MHSRQLVFLAIVLVLSLNTQAKRFSEPEFHGKVVLVTGGTTGIGYQTALSFAREGAKVVIVARDSRPECYNGTYAQNSINNDAEVRSVGGVAMFIRADIRNSTQIQNALNITEKYFGHLDIAVNNAGIGGYSANIEEIPEYVPFSEHDPILNNLYGVYNCMREQVKYWKRLNRTGSIINVSSTNGIRSCPGCSMYAASKYGIIGLTKSVAFENLNNPYIRVNALAPGLVDTFLTRDQVNMIEYGKQSWEGHCIRKEDPLWLKHRDEFKKAMQKGELLEPQQEADIILYLASSRASAITGTVMNGDFGDSGKQ